MILLKIFNSVFQKNIYTPKVKKKITVSLQVVYGQQRVQ